MEYSQTYFGKPFTELTYADIESFFSTERFESDQIEFKSYHDIPIDPQLLNLTQGISAFLNSSGGILIWGAPKGVVREGKGKKEKVFVGPLTTLPLNIEKDWLISKIVDKIIPLPIGIRVRLIDSEEGQVAVFEIDESIYAPHQTGNSYLMRIDGQNKPAPHHYIEALFKKITFPRLEAFIKPGRTEEVEGGFIVRVEFLFINFSPFLNEENLFYRLIVTNGFFQGAKGSPGFRSYDPTYHLQFGMNGQEFHTGAKLNNALFYGQPLRVEKEFYFPKKRISINDYQANLLIFLGGRSAPIKCCQYKFDFRNIRNGVMTFSVDYENQLMSQRATEDETSELDMLNQLSVLR